jgi:hypothetical protein
MGIERVAWRYMGDKKHLEKNERCKCVEKKSGGGVKSGSGWVEVVSFDSSDQRGHFGG